MKVRYILKDGTEKVYEYDGEKYKQQRNQRKRQQYQRKRIPKTCPCGNEFRTNPEHDHVICQACRNRLSYVQVGRLNCEECGEPHQGNPSRKHCDSCRKKRRGGSWRAKGRLHPSGKSLGNGRIRNRDGYIYVNAPSGHPRFGKCGRKPTQIGEHRLVMEGIIGRYLESSETVHHKNGIRDDNRPENLELWSKNHRSGVRAIDLVADIVRLYPDWVKAELRRQTAAKKVVQISDYQTSLFEAV